MLGKCMTQVLKLAVILQALENCYKLITELKSINKFIINESIEKELDVIIKNSSHIVIISLPCFNNAKRLLSYYNLNRLTMAGYKTKEIQVTNELTVQNIIEHVSITCVNAIEDLQLHKVCKIVLESEGVSVNSTAVSQKHRLAISLVLNAFEYLKAKNLGEIVLVNRDPSTPGPKKSKIFKKITMEELELNLQLISLIENLNVNMLVYRNSLENKIDKKRTEVDETNYEVNQDEGLKEVYL